MARLMLAILLALAGCAERPVPVTARRAVHRPDTARVHLVDRTARRATRPTVAQNEVLAAQDALLSRAPGSAERAAALYRDAAGRGSAVAEYNLGVFREEGIGMAVDRQEAAGWFRRAVARHDPAVQDLASSRLAALATAE